MDDESEEEVSVKKNTKQVKASCYLVNKNYKGAVDEFSIIWGIIENLPIPSRLNPCYKCWRTYCE